MKRRTVRQRAEAASKRAYPERWGQWAINDRCPYQNGWRDGYRAAKREGRKS